MLLLWKHFGNLMILSNNNSFSLKFPKVCSYPPNDNEGKCCCNSVAAGYSRWKKHPSAASYCILLQEHEMKSGPRAPRQWVKTEVAQFFISNLRSSGLARWLAYSSCCIRPIYSTHRSSKGFPDNMYRTGKNNQNSELLCIYVISARGYFASLAMCGGGVIWSDWW